ncbi:fimbrial assembly protein (plasmid) [Pantoea sp. OXWO6B1]|nr:fimbrial assembly protein [Pantoea sp. OXWO6B1]
MGVSLVHADDLGVDFNTDVLDVKDRNNINLNQFSHAGYIMPGEYSMSVNVNDSSLQEENIEFIKLDNKPDETVACLSPQLVKKFGFKDEIYQKLSWLRGGKCLNVHADVVKGIVVKGDIAKSRLVVTIPQAYLEYTSATWDPPSRWDDGVSGLISDYNLNLMKVHGLKSGSSSSNLSGNGTVGMNIGAWRLRADWQANHSRYGDTPVHQQWEWNRYYLFRAIRSLGAKLILGEDYLDSDLFDSPRLAGLRLVSDDNQLPPNLRGYAPEVTGIARTHAKVTISDQGRIIYESQVAPGPFRIQTLSDTTNGTLDVKVTEQDGKIKKYQINTATVPYLSRPGLIRYKLAMGRPDDMRHRVNGPLLSTGEFSWGINNGWSLYGGSLFGNGYQTLSGGIGRDLMIFGALAADVSAARADLPDSKRTFGKSYKLSYSKTFDSIDSQVTFAGYRFSQRTFVSLNDFLDALDQGIRPIGNKQIYTVSLNKQFSSIGLSSNFNISRQTYWNDTPADVRYSFSLSKYFDIGRFKNISFSLSAYRNKFNSAWDRGGYFSISLPLGNADTISYSESMSNGVLEHDATYFTTIDEHNSYQVSAGNGNTGSTGSASFSHEGSSSEIDASAGWQEGNYVSGGLTLRGGMTITACGAAMHRTSQAGGTRLMLDTEGVSGVPVHGYGSTTNTNAIGIAVISDITSYYHNEASIDMDHLPDDVTASSSVVADTLTEGAIGYRRFSVVAGRQAMAVIGLKDGQMAPFGATVRNAKGQQTGLVGDSGNTWLSGMRPSETMSVEWDGKVQCTFKLPKRLDVPALFLPCIRSGNHVN